MRTTIDIDDPIPADLKRLQQPEGRSLGRLVSGLLPQSLAPRQSAPKPAAAGVGRSSPLDLTAAAGEQTIHRAGTVPPMLIAN